MQFQKNLYQKYSQKALWIGDQIHFSKKKSEKKELLKATNFLNQTVYTKSTKMISLCFIHNDIFEMEGSIGSTINSVNRINTSQNGSQR